MSRKDYILIADVLRATVADNDLRATIAREFAYRLKADNPNFDAGRFMAAVS